MRSGEWCKEKMSVLRKCDRCLEKGGAQKRPKEPAEDEARLKVNDARVNDVVSIAWRTVRE